MNSALLDFAEQEQQRFSRDIDDLERFRAEVHRAFVASDFRLSEETYATIRARYPDLKTPEQLADAFHLLDATIKGAIASGGD